MQLKEGQTEDESRVAFLYVFIANEIRTFSAVMKGFEWSSLLRRTDFTPVFGYVLNRISRGRLFLPF